jgi:hypothetical protein
MFDIDASKDDFDAVCQQYLPFITDRILSLRLSDDDFLEFLLIRNNQMSVKENQLHNSFKFILFFQSEHIIYPCERKDQKI